MVGSGRTESQPFVEEMDAVQDWFADPIEVM